MLLVSWYDKKEDDDDHDHDAPIVDNTEETIQIDRDEQREKAQLRRKLLSRFDNGLTSDSLVADDFDDAW
jgi:hypothetical protein